MFYPDNIFFIQQLKENPVILVYLLAGISLMSATAHHLDAVKEKHRKNKRTARIHQRWD